ncbi:MAG: hypothetical protein LVR00_02130 [Rhabdochlamydiaceae bacterium]|jgi:uncharacterized membrane protein
MRIELIHPLLVHFPIALLLVGSFLRLAAFCIGKKPRFSFLIPGASLILLLGVVSAWVAVIFGDIAGDIVAPAIKDISILNEHHEHAHYTAYGFTLALLTDWLRRFLMDKQRKRGWMANRGLAIMIWFFYIGGFVNLFVAGYYGSELVYKEGAAVHQSYDK